MNEQAIAILRVANAAAAVAWYERLGFTQEWEHRFELPAWFGARSRRSSSPAGGR